MRRRDRVTRAVSRWGEGWCCILVSVGVVVGVEEEEDLEVVLVVAGLDFEIFARVEARRMACFVLALASPAGVVAVAMGSCQKAHAGSRALCGDS